MKLELDRDPARPFEPKFDIFSLGGIRRARDGRTTLGKGFRKLDYLKLSFKQVSRLKLRGWQKAASRVGRHQQA